MVFLVNNCSSHGVQQLSATHGRYFQERIAACKLVTQVKSCVFRSVYILFLIELAHRIMGV